MKTIKVSEATGIVLDYLVAKCAGDTPTIRMFDNAPGGRVYKSASMQHQGIPFQPTTNWEQGGPIIERECIATYASGACSVPPKNPDYWVAEILATDGMFTQFGPTPLIAALRCFVTSKLGETVEVPEELG